MKWHWEQMGMAGLKSYCTAIHDPFGYGRKITNEATLKLILSFEDFISATLEFNSFRKNEL